MHFSASPDLWCGTYKAVEVGEVESILDIVRAPVQDAGVLGGVAATEGLLISHPFTGTGAGSLTVHQYRALAQLLVAPHTCALLQSSLHLHVDTLGHSHAHHSCHHHA